MRLGAIQTAPLQVEKNTRLNPSITNAVAPCQARLAPRRTAAGRPLP